MNLSESLSHITFLKEVSETADTNKTDVYIVGGFVRDLILNRKSDEIDFLVIGDGVRFAGILASKFGIKNVVVYKNFGTAHFRFQNFNLEFVSARKESYDRNSRKPHVLPGSFEDDIKRRDFTINTVAVAVNSSNFGEIVDLYDGLKDIKNKLIKTPLNPVETFSDDPLRILRAFRFASQLQFNVDEDVFKAASEMKHRLEIISQERKTDEFLKILASPKPSVGLKLMYNTTVMQQIFPEIAEMGGVEQRKDHHHKDVFLHTCQVLDNIAAVTDNLWLRFAALVHDIAKPATKKFIEGTGWTFHGHEELGARMMNKIFRQLKLPLHKLEYVQKLIRLHLRPIALAAEDVTDSAIRRLIVNAGEDLEDLITLCRADITSKNLAKVEKYLENYDKVMEKVREVKEKDKLRAFQSPVRGEEIMKICNLNPSPMVGKLKKAIEDAILDGKIGNTYEEAYQYLLSIKDEYLSKSEK